MRCPVFQRNTYALRLDGFWSVDCLVSSPIARDIWTRSGRRACTSMSLFFLQRLFSWYCVYMMKWLICVGAPWWKLLLSPLIGGRMFIVTDLLLGVGWQPPYVEFIPSGFCLTLVPLPFVRDNFQGPGCYKYFQAMRCQVSPFWEWLLIIIANTLRCEVWTTDTPDKTPAAVLGFQTWIDLVRGFPKPPAWGWGRGEVFIVPSPQA